MRVPSVRRGAEIGTTPLADINYDWTEQWISALKREKHLAPGTIRKKKGALSRVLDWAARAHPLWLGDCERNRRIDRVEESRILQVLRLRPESSTLLEEHAEAEGLTLMFQVALRTAMRMRELYTLAQDQISITARTVFLQKTKNGDRREVRISSHGLMLLNTPWPALEATRQGGRVFPFWDGRLDSDVLRATTSRVSALFAGVFDEVGAEDLHFHDSRHEALCRWVLEAPRPLTSEQLGRAADMRDARTRQRYLSLRGSELADMLG
jgi:integrase